jgi:hypothetical protein
MILDLSETLHKWTYFIKFIWVKILLRGIVFDIKLIDVNES